jgi:NADH dehydrogenase
VLLVEAGDRLLRGFPESLSAKAARSLVRLGVTPLVAHEVSEISESSVEIRALSGKLQHVEARTAIWAAGVQASGLAATLADDAGVGVDRAGRIAVRPDLTLAGHPEVIALGDMISIRADDGTVSPLPGLAPVAIQQGRYAARLIERRLQERPVRPFHYRDKGNLATIGRSRAVAEIKGLRLSGFAAWIVWLVVHLFYLIGIQNRFLVLLRWIVTFATRRRGARLIREPDEQGLAHVRSQAGTLG